MKYENFAFDYGYAESTRHALLLMKHEEGFEDPIEGLKDLDNLLRECIASERGITVNGRIEISSYSHDCCKKYHTDLEMNLCPKCGRKFLREKFEDICTEGIWYELCCGDNDSLGGAAWELIEDSKWSIIGPEGGEWVTVNYARKISEGSGFFINAIGLYDFKYISEDIYSEKEEETVE